MEDKQEYLEDSYIMEQKRILQIEVDIDLRIEEANKWIEIGHFKMVN